MGTHIEYIIEARTPMKFYDPELWSFLDEHMGANLRNLSDDALIKRLLNIEKNIQYLNGSHLIDFDGHPDEGWTSFTWWLRSRHWTQIEVKRRNLSPATSAAVAKAVNLDPLLVDITRSETGILARVGQEQYLKLFLHGQLRFSPAATYNDCNLDAARADDEMKKRRSRPGQALTIRLPDGRVATPVGDVQFAAVRQSEVGGRLFDHPYLFCSFSSEVDPRLIAEFPGSDAVLVIFDVDAFMERSLKHLQNALPALTKGLVVNDYYDPYYIGRHRLGAIRSKELEYALQREVRFLIEPGNDAHLASKVIESQADSFGDIAAIYNRAGELIDGTGPARPWTD